METSGAKVKPANLLRADGFQFEYRHKSCPASSNLDLLTYGTYRIAAGATSDELFHRHEEALLFCLAEAQTVSVDDRIVDLAHYDTLYIPLATPYRIRNESGQEGLLAVCRAPAVNRHPLIHSSWRKVRADEARIRRLKGKNVYLMFDVSASADKLIAGYTIYEPFTRAWPVHNHTDQEEIYIFTQGRGAMEVYGVEETKTFVHDVGPLDAVTIPLLNYHPVFSQDQELHFIWCIAGKRYWVGDKDKAFMDGSVDKLTT